MFPATTRKMPSAKAILSAATSAAATAVLLRSIARNYLPREVRDHIDFKLKTFIDSFSSEFSLVIEEQDNLNNNLLFKAAELYLGSIIPVDAQRLKISRGKKESKFTISLEKDQEIIDTFDGVTLKWKFISKEAPLKYLPNYDRSVLNSDQRSFELSFHKKHKNMVIDIYLEHVIKKSEEMKKKKKSLKLFTLKHDRVASASSRKLWQSVNLDHPATFETLAMDMELKKEIMEDLERFVKRKEFYRRVGKAWKRGYLLFGPPGTGKSSLIAAMANYLKFDIYDLELTDIRSNFDLRKLMISTENKSILVVEDIDCSMELQDRHAQAKAMSSRFDPGYNPTNQVTLSGFLNFIDGLWSSCGDERIIIFTTNHKDKIDPALLRPGRMDVHIHMPYCTPCGFRMLAMNYHGISEHPLFMDVENLIELTKVTPAEVGEQLMKSTEPEAALTSLIELLKCKKIESEKKAEEDRNKTSNEESETTEGERGQELDMNRTVP